MTESLCFSTETFKFSSDSFDIDGGTDEYISVPVFRKGPLYVRLKLLKSVCIVDGFDKDQNEKKGEIEEDGRINKGDRLISVNNVSIRGKSIKEIQSCISEAAESSKCRYFVFRRNNFSTNNIKLVNQNDQRNIAFQSILNETLVNEGKLRNLASLGVPDSLNVRGIVWRVLLKYLPLDQDLWKPYLIIKRQEYNNLITTYTNFININDNVKIKTSLPIHHPNNNINENDHPLSNDIESSWNNYFKDVKLYEEIYKDVLRTYPDIEFFINESNSSNVQIALLRILYIFAKVNPNISYVQGMNDIVGTLYYVFANDNNNEWSEYAEIDTYYCFTIIILENYEIYIREFDYETNGLHNRIALHNQLLQRHDKEIFNQITNQGIDPSFYSLRWLTTLLSREFNLSDTIRLWDTLFADTIKKEFLSYFCCHMILKLRDELLQGDFAMNLHILQNYPSCDIVQLIAGATELRAKDFHTKDIDYTEDYADGDVRNNAVLEDIGRGISNTISSAASAGQESYRRVVTDSTAYLQNLVNYTEKHVLSAVLPQPPRR